MIGGQFGNWPGSWVNVAGGPRFTVRSITPFSAFGVKCGQLVNWPLELMNAAGGPRFTGDNITGLKRRRWFGGRLLNWPIAQTSEQKIVCVRVPIRYAY